MTTAGIGDMVAWQDRHAWQYGTVVAYAFITDMVYVRPFHGRDPGPYPKQSAELTVIMPAIEFVVWLEYQQTFLRTPEPQRLDR